MTDTSDRSQTATDGQHSPLRTDGGQPDDDSDWAFEAGDIVREEHAKPSPVPGKSHAPKSEYKIERRLVDPDNGEQFYHVEKEEGGTHLYSAGVLNRYERIDVSESQAWGETIEVTRE